MFRCAFIISLQTGIRRGELSGLCIEDINFDSDTININKQLLYIDGHTHLEDTPKSSHSLRSIPLNDTLKDIFIDLIKKIEENQKVLNDYYIIPQFNNKKYNFF